MRYNVFNWSALGNSQIYFFFFVSCFPSELSCKGQQRLISMKASFVSKRKKKPIYRFTVTSHLNNSNSKKINKIQIKLTFHILQNIFSYWTSLCLWDNVDAVLIRQKWTHTALMTLYIKMANMLFKSIHSLGIKRTFHKSKCEAFILCKDLNFTLGLHKILPINYILF